MKEYDLTVVVGRFQPLHVGHIELINRAIINGTETLILVGSSYKSRDQKNPFTYEQREQMLRAQFGSQIMVKPLVDDLYDDSDWVEQVQDAIASVSHAEKIAIVGHRKQDTFYLDWFPQFNLIEFDGGHQCDATKIRHMFYETGELAKKWLSDQVRDFLNKPQQMQSLRWAAGEYKFIQQYQKPYENLPYKPIFVTVDAVTVCAGHVLLVKRKAMPGRGLWAIPGGFLNADEHIIPATLRELSEETGLKVTEKDIKFTKVFDHPNRSQRGRTITHASLISIPTRGKLPRVKGSDDAEKAKWIPLHEFYDMSDQMFEDHFSIVTHMIRRA